MQRLTEQERTQALSSLPEWTHEPDRDAIVRTFQFPDFVTAFSFMTAVALEAEKADHHPEWSNVYGRVSVLLTTHDTDGLSERDINLARKVSALSFCIRS
ncbi:4a-hydroxytetrahydrobiopterin dehydratase [Sphingobium sp. OAS761]|uniref:4a-hydroxytetrahydrobiopterin dehydratase n=1 Tax=Sphingobium sp. OAS761 TaxID=2817901 RepID=UPI00209D0B59|nr:4a-hydroxytetrahydrobiopterin dehydratase [Sphingobium sp. OAS761]MCP1470483.1 4a-hydroxytetrahydrobiopterin dehydratase [Sphingobium sp. OAS761]